MIAGTADAGTTADVGTEVYWDTGAVEPGQQALERAAKAHTEPPALVGTRHRSPQPLLSPQTYHQPPHRTPAPAQQPTLWICGHEQYLLDENFTAPGAGQLGASKSTRRADSPLGAGAETVKTYWERRALWVPCWDRVSVIWVVGRTIFLYSISTLHLLERTGEGDD
jgi:hypothetical protein